MTYWLGEDFAFAVALPFDENPATNGNGTMIGFSVGTSEDVISAYVRDLDKNKISTE